MKAHAVVRLRFPSKRNLSAALNALNPETKRAPTSRFKVRLESEENSLLMRFEASDTSALRAAMNSYLRWISLVNETCSVLDSFSK